MARASGRFDFLSFSSLSAINHQPSTLNSKIHLMNITTIPKLWERLLNWIKLLIRKPSLKDLDFTGIINSDYPKVGNGWVKGWLVNTPSRDRVIVAAHGNPAAGQILHAIDAAGQRVARTIVAVKVPVYDVGKVSSVIKGGDIAICRVGAPFPPSIRAYEIARDLGNGQFAVTRDKEGKTNTGTINTANERAAAWLFADFSRTIKPGDSGLPWFVLEGGKWKVASHSSRGAGGQGPWYSHERILSRLKTDLAD